MDDLYVPRVEAIATPEAPKPATPRCPTPVHSGGELGNLALVRLSSRRAGAGWPGSRWSPCSFWSAAGTAPPALRWHLGRGDGLLAAALSWIRLADPGPGWRGSPWRRPFRSGGPDSWPCPVRDLPAELPLIVAAPIVWVGLEFLREYLLTGFPWYFLAHSSVSVLAGDPGRGPRGTSRSVS